jgi:hypothetical protein
MPAAGPIHSCGTPKIKAPATIGLRAHMTIAEVLNTMRLLCECAFTGRSYASRPFARDPLSPPSRELIRLPAQLDERLS